MYAAATGSADTVSFLLEKKADPLIEGGLRTNHTSVTWSRVFTSITETCFIHFKIHCVLRKVYDAKSLATAFIA